MVAVFGLGALPNASADGCTFTITVAGGQQFTFQNVPPGTDPTSLPLPVSLPITNVAQSCPPVTATTPAATVTTTTPAPTTSTSTSTSTSALTTPKPKPSKGASSTPTTTVQVSTPTTKGSGKGKSQSSGLLNIGAGEAGSNLKQPGAPKSKSKSKKAKTTPAPPPAVTKSGVPTPSNPTYSYAVPGAAPIGVPNFFISSFQIPPFLLPIYQAAGIQYDVPWQILAAINEIETDYGRNLSVSSAGAVGWMQFLPSTWKRYAVDANGDGVADPYNPADAIFTAARYLHAAGASKSVQNAIFAYNHAGWYVQSVMLRAQLIGGMPKQFINSLTDLVQGHFPVAAPAKYADDAVLKLAKSRVKGSNAAVTVQSDPNSKGTAIYANQGSPVIAVNDGKVVKIGQSQQLGHYVVLQDATGNTYTYANLGSVPKLYPVPRPVRARHRRLSAGLHGPERVQGVKDRQEEQRVIASRHARDHHAAVHGPDHHAAVRGGRWIGPVEHPHDQRADGQGAAVRQSEPARLLRRRRQAPGGAERTGWHPDLELPGVLLRRAPPGQEPVHAQAAQGGLPGRRGHDPWTPRRRHPDRRLAPRVHDPARRQELALHRPQAHPRRLEATRGDRRLPGRRRESLLRTAGQEPDHRADPSHVQGAAPAARARGPERHDLPLRAPRYPGRRDRPPRPRGHRVPVRVGAEAHRVRTEVRRDAQRLQRDRRRRREWRERGLLGHQRHPDRGPHRGRLDHRRHGTSPAHPSGRHAAQPDRVDDELQEPADCGQVGQPREPHPGLLHAVLRREPEAFGRGVEHAAAQPVDAADQPPEPDQRAARADRAEQVRDQDRFLRRRRQAPPTDR